MFQINYDKGMERDIYYCGTEGASRIRIGKWDI